MEAKRIPHGGPVAGDEKDVRMFPRRAQLRLLATSVALVALVGMQAGSALGAVQPAPAPDTAPSAAVTPLPACTTADALAPFSLYTQWASTYIDTRYRVTSTYVPPVLVSTANAGTNGGYLVRRLVIDDLGAMFRAAKRAGVTIRVAAA